MNTPTEEHRRLVVNVTSAAQTGYEEKAAQLIADSEARAVEKQVKALAIVILRWDRAEKERDQLRTELGKDQARLDWLQNRGWLEKASKGWLCGEMTRVGNSDKSVRAAIDKAMKESK